MGISLVLAGIWIWRQMILVWVSKALNSWSDWPLILAAVRTAFAVDGQGGNVQFLEMGTEPVGDKAIQLGRGPGAGGRGGWSFRWGPGSLRVLRQRLARKLRSWFWLRDWAELADIDQGVIARNHGGGGDGDDGGHFCDGASLGSGGDRGGRQGLEQALWFVGRSRDTRGDRPVRR